MPMFQNPKIPSWAPAAFGDLSMGLLPNPNDPRTYPAGMMRLGGPVSRQPGGVTARGGRNERPAWTPADVIRSQQSTGDWFQSRPPAAGTAAGNIGTFGSSFMGTYIPTQAEARMRENERISADASRRAISATDLQGMVDALAGGDPQQRQTGLQARIPLLVEEEKRRNAERRFREFEAAEQARQPQAAPPPAAPQGGGGQWPDTSGVTPSPEVNSGIVVPPPQAPFPGRMNLGGPMPQPEQMGVEPAATPVQAPGERPALMDQALRLGPQQAPQTPPAPEGDPTANRREWFRPRGQQTDQASPERRTIINQLRAGMITPEEAKMRMDVLGQRPYEEAYDKHSAQQFSDMYKEMRTSASTAQRSLNDWRIFEQLAMNPNTLQGPGAQSISIPLRRLGATLGIQSEGLDTTQLFQAIAGRMALEARNPANGAGMPGAMSDADRQFLERITGGVPNTREANIALARIHQKLAQRQVEAFENALIYSQNNRGRLDHHFDALQSSWAQRNPLFNERDAAVLSGGNQAATATQPPAQPPQTAQQAAPPMTQQQLDALAPGSVIEGRDGRLVRTENGTFRRATPEDEMAFARNYLQKFLGNLTRSASPDMSDPASSQAMDRLLQMHGRQPQSQPGR